MFLNVTELRFESKSDLSSHLEVARICSQIIIQTILFLNIVFGISHILKFFLNLIPPYYLTSQRSQACISFIFSCFPLKTMLIVLYCTSILLVFSPFPLTNYVSCIVLFPILAHFPPQIPSHFPSWILSHFLVHFLYCIAFKKLVSPIPTWTWTMKELS